MRLCRVIYESSGVTVRMKLFRDESHCHTQSGTYDCLIVRSVAIWRTCDRSAMFATIASSDRILRSVFLPGGRSSYDWSYAWSRDQQRLEKIVRLVVAINDRSYDRSWPPTECFRRYEAATCLSNTLEQATKGRYSG